MTGKTILERHDRKTSLKYNFPVQTLSITPSSNHLRNESAQPKLERTAKMGCVRRTPPRTPFLHFLFAIA